MDDHKCLDFDRSIRESGHCVASEALESVTTAKTVRVRDGKVRVMDGPFAETKEQLAGYFIIEVPDFDAAIAWAARHPAASHGAVEVRQIGNPPTP